MSAAAFSKYSFQRTLKAGDSSRFGVDLKGAKAQEIDKAIECARDPVAMATFNELTVGGRVVVSYTDYSVTLVLRSLASNVKYRSRLKMPNRDAIVRGVIQAAEDATPMAIFRRDVVSFYESVPLAPIKDALLRSALLSPLATTVLEAFFEIHCAGQTHGLPRGLSLSAVLAELAMQSFDQAVRSHPSIYRYFRFSDDILIFSHDLAFDVDAFLKETLPNGLSLHLKKSNDLKMTGSGAMPSFSAFEYLGYSFNLSNGTDKKSGLKRAVSVTIANSKVKKAKSRIILSLKSFVKSADISLLVDRIAFIASNYGVRRTGINVVGPKRTVSSGIYFNYKLCQNGPDGSALPKYEHGLSDLDGFLQSILFGSGSKFRLAVQAKANALQQSRLREISFLKGYQTPMMLRFKPQRMGAIKSAWVYVK
jgi:hypothetical protein